MTKFNTNFVRNSLGAVNHGWRDISSTFGAIYGGIWETTKLGGWNLLNSTLGTTYGGIYLAANFSTRGCIARFKIPAIKNVRRGKPLPKKMLFKDPTNFRDALRTNQLLRTLKGAWEHFVIGDLVLQTKEEIVSNIENNWTNSTIWKHTNAALVYPIAVGTDIQTIALASSTIISRDSSPGEIYEFVKSCWERKINVYGEANVSSLIALNIKSCFYVPSESQVFGGGNIRVVGDTPINLQADPKRYFQSNTQQLFDDLGWLFNTPHKEPVSRFLMAAIHFSTMHRKVLATNLQHNVMKEVTTILRWEFLLGHLTAFRADPQDPTKKGGRELNDYLSFSYRTKLYYLNVNTGVIFVVVGKQANRYQLFEQLDPEFIDGGVPKELSTGNLILNTVNNAWYSITGLKMFKHFEFPTIPKRKRYTPSPNPKGWDFIVVDFEMYHKYVSSYNAAQLNLYAGGIHWNDVWYNENYKTLKKEWIALKMREAKGSLKLQQVETLWREYAIQHKLVVDLGRKTKMFMFDPELSAGRNTQLQIFKAPEIDTQQQSVTIQRLEEEFKSVTEGSYITTPPVLNFIQQNSGRTVDQLIWPLDKHFMIQEFFAINHIEFPHHKDRLTDMTGAPEGLEGGKGNVTLPHIEIETILKKVSISNIIGDLLRNPRRAPKIIREAISKVLGAHSEALREAIELEKAKRLHTIDSDMTQLFLDCISKIDLDAYEVRQQLDNWARLNNQLIEAEHRATALYIELAQLQARVEELRSEHPQSWCENLFTEETTVLSSKEELAVVFWKYIAGLCLKSPECDLVYIHNLQFDIQYLLPTLHKIFDLKITMKDRQFKQVKCYINDELIFSIQCSYNKTGLSLRNLARHFKVDTQKGHWPHKWVTEETLHYIGPKPAYEFFTNQLSAGNNISKEQWEVDIPQLWDTWAMTQNYLRGDVKATWESILAVTNLAWTEYGVNFHLSLTAPALAKNLYLKKFNQELLANIDPTSWVDHLIRQTYFGGVQEILRTSLEEGFEFDVNSMYPNAMMSNMPIRSPSLIENPAYEQVKEPNLLWYLQVEVYVPPQELPPIPVRNENGLTHPTGFVTANITGTELIYAVEHCGVEILAMPWGVCFEGSNLPFREYVQELFAKRLQAKRDGNKSLSELIKLFLNSTYGGFAMHAPVFINGIVETSKVEYLEKVHGVDFSVDIDEKYSLVSYKKAADLAMWETIEDEDPAKAPRQEVLAGIKHPMSYPPELNVAIAAQITAQSRVLIRTLIHEIINQGGVVAYSATDSVYTNLNLAEMENFKHLVGPELGKFKLERSFKEGCWVRGGLYALKGCSDRELILKHGGYNRGDISYEDVRNLALKGETINRFKATWEQGIVTNNLSLEGAYKWTERKIRLSTNTKKRFAIEYGGYRLGLVPLFLLGGRPNPTLQYQMWRMFNPLPMIPELCLSTIHDNISIMGVTYFSRAATKFLSDIALSTKESWFTPKGLYLPLEDHSKLVFINWYRAVLTTLENVKHLATLTDYDVNQLILIIRLFRNQPNICLWDRNMTKTFWVNIDSIRRQIFILSETLPDADQLTTDGELIYRISVKQGDMAPWLTWAHAAESYLKWKYKHKSVSKIPI